MTNNPRQEKLMAELSKCPNCDRIPVEDSINLQMCCSCGLASASHSDREIMRGNWNRLCEAVRLGREAMAQAPEGYRVVRVGSCGVGEQFSVDGETASVPRVAESVTPYVIVEPIAPAPTEDSVLAECGKWLSWAVTMAKLNAKDIGAISDLQKSIDAVLGKEGDGRACITCDNFAGECPRVMREPCIASGNLVNWTPKEGAVDAEAASECGPIVFDPLGAFVTDTPTLPDMTVSQLQCLSESDMLAMLIDVQGKCRRCANLRKAPYPTEELNAQRERIGKLERICRDQSSDLNRERRDVDSATKRVIELEDLVLNALECWPSSNLIADEAKLIKAKRAPVETCEECGGEL